MFGGDKSIESDLLHTAIDQKWNFVTSWSSSNRHFNTYVSAILFYQYLSAYDVGEATKQRHDFIYMRLNCAHLCNNHPNVA